MRVLSALRSLLLAGACASCSPAKPAPVKDVSAAEVRPAKPVTEDDGPLQPAAAPQDLFVLGRLKAPEAAVDRISSWIHLPIPWREALEREHPELAQKLDARAPVDLAVTLDPDAMGVPAPLFALSLGLVDLNATLDAFRASNVQVERLGGGTYFVKLGSDLRCAASRANGLASARLVCSDKRKALDLLAPYMTRSLPLEELAADDVYVVVRAEPLRQRFGKKAHMIKVGVPLLLREVSLGNARFDTALADAAHATADELIALIDEVDELRLRASLSEADAEARGQLELELDGKRSLTSRLLRDTARFAGPPPDLFWALPKSVTNAQYSTRREPGDHYRPIADTLGELLLGAAEHYGVKAPAVESWITTSKALFAAEGPTVYASGPVTNQSLPKTVTGALVTALGYHVVGVEGDAGRVAKLLEDSVALWNDAKLRKLAEQTLDEKLRHVPLVKKGTAKGLPPGSIAYTWTLTPKDVAKLEPQGSKLDAPLTLQMWVVPQGTRTWFVFAGDPKTLDEVTKQLLKGDASQSLSSRPGLEDLRGEPAISGGFFTLSAYAPSLDAMAQAEEGPPKVSSRDVLLAMPNRGETPIVFRSTASAEGPKVVFSSNVPKAAFEDLTAAIVSLAARGGAF